MSDKAFNKRLRELTDDAIRESLAEISVEFERRYGQTETGWLIEEDAGGFYHWIALAKDAWPRTEIHVRRRHLLRDVMVETDKYRSPIVRVKDASLAIRFARKEDAEAFIKLFDRFLLCPKATEHAWSLPTPAQTASGE